MSRIVFTCGDINGIGPEISIKALNKLTSKKTEDQFILIIPQNIFEQTKKLVEPMFRYAFLTDDNSKLSSEPGVSILPLKSHKQRVGLPTKTSGEAAFSALNKSFKLVDSGLADAVITAPVSKTALKLAGSKFPGQTEMFAEWSGVKTFVMTFLSNKLRVCLYSIHIPLRDVSKSLKINEITNKLKVIISMLKYDLEISKPRVAMLGLNPHAGEGGIIGTEEENIIIPALKKLNSGSKVEGPFSSDAFFAKKRFKEYDMVFGLYHDQVLIPFKYINAGKGVNYTAGLPIVRTSPDHGVAYDIAGKGIADESSILEAYKYAKLIVRNRKKNLQ